MNDQLYDLIVIGAGHNGLTTAVLQAKRGRKVLVLERRPVAGGLAAGETFHPRYRTTGVLHSTARVRNSVIQALGLEIHGLRRDPQPAAVFAPQLEGPGLVLTPSAEDAVRELRAHSAVDAQRFPEFCQFIERVGEYIRRLMTAPPPAIAPRSFGQYLDLFKKGWALRRLGRDTMYECLRIGPMSVQDWLDEWFESGLLKALIAAPGLLGTWSSPRAAGTTALTLMERSTSLGEIAGGPAALVRALLDACAARGVEIRTETGVRRILVDRHRDRVEGVELDDGTVVPAPRVACSVDPRQTFVDLFRPHDLPNGFEGMVNWRCRGSTAKMHLALDGPLEFECRPNTLFSTVRIAESLTDIERAFDPMKYGELPRRPHLDITVPTVDDPSLAPTGHHVVSILVHYVPRDLKGGWTDDAREQLADIVLSRLSEVAPSCIARLVGRQTLTPEDLERVYNLSGGHVHHGEHGLDQMFSLRPHARCARYRTPFAGLYLCGSGSHPGGGITCAPGQLAAAAIR